MAEAADRVSGTTADESEKNTTNTAIEQDGSTTKQGNGGDLEAAVAKEDPRGESDPTAIGWDGPDDPQNPKNWPDKKKWTNISILSILTLVTYVYGPFSAVLEILS
jgi:hypothetical protein